jgi:hypothetical protein
VCLAVSAAPGPICNDFNSVAFDRETVAIFMDSLAEEVVTCQIANACFILDNCAVHNVYHVTEVCEMFGCEFNFLPPYSPMLSHIEGCIGDVKLAIQTQFPRRVGGLSSIWLALRMASAQGGESSSSCKH